MVVHLSMLRLEGLRLSKVPVWAPLLGTQCWEELVWDVEPIRKVYRASYCGLVQTAYNPTLTHYSYRKTLKFHFQ